MDSKTVLQRMKDGAKLSFNTYTYVQPETYDAYISGGIAVPVRVVHRLAKLGHIKRISTVMVGATLVETYAYVEKET